MNRDCSCMQLDYTELRSLAFDVAIELEYPKSSIHHPNGTILPQKRGNDLEQHRHQISVLDGRLYTPYSPSSVNIVLFQDIDVI